MEVMLDVDKSVVGPKSKDDLVDSFNPKFCMPELPNKGLLKLGDARDDPDSSKDGPVTAAPFVKNLDPCLELSLSFRSDVCPLNKSVKIIWF